VFSETAEYLANAANSLARIDLLPEKIHESNFSKINARNKVEFVKLAISPSPLLSQLLKAFPLPPEPPAHFPRSPSRSVIADPEIAKTIKARSAINCYQTPVSSSTRQNEVILELPSSRLPGQATFI
jgi:hypothetical protein